jgi:hypothetical protein
LEILTLKKAGERQVEVINRLKTILVSLTPLEEHKIDRIYSLRNNLVHFMRGLVFQCDRNLLKCYVELMIEFFMFNLAEYAQDEIREIFRFLQKDVSALGKSKRLIDLVVKLKS